MDSGGNEQELDRPIWGAKAIAEEMNINSRKAFYLMSAGKIPATKIGNQWVTTRRRLIDFINQSINARHSEK